MLKFIKKSVEKLKEFLEIIVEFCKQITLGFLNITNEYPRIFKATLSFVIVIAMFVTVISYTGVVKAYAISLDGISVGCVDSKTAVDNAKTLAKEKIYDSLGKEEIEKVIVTEVLTGKKNIASAEEIVAPLLNNAKNIKSVAALKVDDKVIGFMNKEEEISALLDNVVNSKKSDSNVLSVEVCDNVTVSSVYCSSKTLETSEDLKEIVENNDVVPCKTVQYVTSKKEVAYKTVKVKSSSLYEGTSKVQKRGEKGLNEVVEKVSFIDGKEVKRETVSSKVIKEPKSALMMVGTKPYQKAQSTTNEPNNKGLIWPVDTSVKNYITSYYGDGRNHKGYDIACKTGTKIFASLGGKVIQSGWYGGYGLCITLDNGNGYQTRYAHCSKLFVEVGDVVTRGENIALIGSTGQSTGPHVHFEIIVNGTHRNPAYYLGK